MTNETLPRLVIIVSNGPLVVGRPEQLAGRATISAAISSPDLPLYAIATTVATGFDAIIHGVVTSSTVDSETLKVRPTTYKDRRFPAIWSGAGQTGIQTALIDWPISEGDPDITTELGTSVIDSLVDKSASIDTVTIESLGLEDKELNARAFKILERNNVSFTQAKDVLTFEHPPHIIGIALENPLFGEMPQSITKHIQAELESFLSSLAEETNVLIVHKKTNESGNSHNLRFVLEATFLVDGCERETLQPVALKSIGGAAYVLANIPCPMGVLVPKFAFLESNKESNPSPVFPAQVSKDETDWLAISDKLLDLRNSGNESAQEAILILIIQFSTMSQISFLEHRWAQLEQYSNYLMKIRGRAVDYWFKILAIHQQGRLEELPEAVDRLTVRFVDQHISAIAKSLLLIEDSPEEVKLLLEGIDPREIQVGPCVGTFGRLLIRAGLIDQGVKALTMMVRSGIAIPADRAVLANVFLDQEKYELAHNAIGRIGLSKGHLSWRLIRLQILVALQKKDEAIQLATSIKEQYPSSSVAQTILEGK